MKPTYIFPIVMIVMNVGAAVMCVIGKDYKKAVYNQFIFATLFILF